MASVHRRRKSKVWIAFFRDAYGVQHGRSTGLTNRKAAQRVADEYEAAGRETRTLRQVVRTLNDMHQLIGGARVELVSVRDYVVRWLGAKKNEVAPALWMRTPPTPSDLSNS